MALVTVADVLRSPGVREAGAKVLAGHGQLNRQVRWVHSAELADIGPLLRGGDLLLSTGIALPETGEELRTFARSLSDSAAAGLMIELGRRWRTVPDALIEACETAGLPLVALTREVRFAAIAQAVGERIVDEQLSELREAQRVHDTFTELSIEEAGPREILAAVQRLSGAAVVLESDDHQVLDYRAGPDDVTTFLANWASRSRSARITGRTEWIEHVGWLVTRIGKRGRGWGRLVVESPEAPSQRLIAMAERAAAALALQRMHDRHRDSLVRRLHHELLLGLLSDPTDSEILRRCELAGFPIGRRRFVGLTIRPLLRGADQGDVVDSSVEDVIAQAVRSAHELKTPALVCEIDRDVRVLFSCAVSANPNRVVDQLAHRVARRHRVLTAAGRPAESPFEIDRTIREAQHVISSVRSDRSDRVHRLEDVHLRGLLALLGDDDRLRLFVDRELSALKEYDARSGTGLLDAVRALVTYPISKSQAAKSLHVSRPVFYDRLAKAGHVLGVDLDDPDIRVALHVALIADEAAVTQGP